MGIIGGPPIGGAGNIPGLGGPPTIQTHKCQQTNSGTFRNTSLVQPTHPGTSLLARWIPASRGTSRFFGFSPSLKLPQHTTLNRFQSHSKKTISGRGYFEAILFVP